MTVLFLLFAQKKLGYIYLLFADPELAGAADAGLRAASRGGIFLNFRVLKFFY